MEEVHEVFESVARYFSVLGEPTRLRILYALCREERCVNDIIRLTGTAQANVSRHLGLMYQAGMLARRREGTQIFYRVADPVFVELCRTVAAQISGRVPAAPFSPDDAGQSVPAPSSGPGLSPGPKRHPPANQKEEASV